MKSEVGIKQLADYAIADNEQGVTGSMAFIDSYDWTLFDSLALDMGGGLFLGHCCDEV